MDMDLSKLWEIVKDREVWPAAVHRVKNDGVTEQQQQQSKLSDNFYLYHLYERRKKGKSVQVTHPKLKNFLL